MLVINENVLRKVMQDFYLLTKIRFVLFDSDFNEILAYPKEKIDFCEQIRKNVEWNAKCVKCDQEGFRACAEQKKLITYRCHHGLQETVVPIFDKHGVIGYVMFGQSLPIERSDKVKKALKRKFPDLQFHDIGKAIDNIPVKSDRELNAAATILQALTVYVLNNQWVTPQKSDFIRQLDQYIQDHLDHNITVEALCMEFNIGRTRLYELAEDYLKCGLSEYVRRKKIEHAQIMLRKTELPISEIAYATGFSDYTHFSRVFKQQCGITARQYRQGLEP